jgi:23S rRNA G2445 N2-methylase RlmL
VAYFERLKEASDDVSEKYGEGFVDLDALGPVTTRPGGGGVLVVSNPPWGKRLDVGGGRDADGQRRSAKRWGARERGGDGYGEEEADDFFLDADAAREEEEDSVGGHSSLETFGEEDDDETQSAWQSLGVFFRRECAGATAHLLSGDAGATRPLRMRAKKKRVLGVGGVDCRLLEYRVLPPKREKNLADLAREAREEEAENRGGSEAAR